MNNKKILVLYADWGNWLINKSPLFSFWFKDLDEAYNEKFQYYVLAFGDRDFKFKYSKNIEVELIKTSPKFQFFAFLKLRKKISEVLEREEISNVYSPFLYLSFLIPNIKNIFKIAFLRDITPEMIAGKGGIRYPLGKLFYLFDYLSFKNLDLIFFNGHSLKEYAIRMGFKGKLVYNPRPIADIDNICKNKVNSKMNTIKMNGGRILLVVARLTKEKNIDLAIRTLKDLPSNIYLFISGQGEEENNLKSLVKEIGLSNRVFFLGHIPHKKIWGLYKGADLLLLLSKSNFEGTPNVLQEAFYMKVPVIVSNMECMKNIVGDNKDGLILKKLDPIELKEKILFLLENKEEYSRIQENQFKKINNIIKEHKRVYEYFK